MSDEPAGPDGDPISAYHVVTVWPDASTAETFATPGELERYLREVYRAAIESDRTDVKVYLFAGGARVRLTGTDRRVAVLPDGTTVTAIDPPERVEEDDRLLPAPTKRA